MSDLNDRMEFDHVIEVLEDGSIYDRPDLHAPDAYDDGRGQIDGIGRAWAPMNGYSGQYGYAGPIMHPSEFIGGGMADDIASTPDVYVAVVVADLDDLDGEPSGWAVLRRNA